MSGARAAFDEVGGDAPLTDAQVDAIVSTDIARLSDDDILARLGLGGDDDTLAFEARWGGDDE